MQTGRLVAGAGAREGFADWYSFELFTFLRFFFFFFFFFLYVSCYKQNVAKLGTFPLYIFSNYQ